MQKSKLESAHYPKMIQEFAKENFNLKLLVATSIAATLISLITTVFLLRRQPTVIALGESGKVAQLEMKTTDLQVKEAVRNYLLHRYTWSETTINSQLKAAEFFVDSSLLVSFRKSMAETARYVKEKHVNQRVYPREDSFHIDLKLKTISLTADRFTEFDQLRAATEMRLTLWFDSGEQTPQNPWGIYVQREQEGAK